MKSSIEIIDVTCALALAGFIGMGIIYFNNTPAAETPATSYTMDESKQKIHTTKSVSAINTNMSQSAIPAYKKDLPKSLDNVDIPGGLPLDKNGNFIPADTTLRLFNFFLSATGEEPDHVIRERIEAYINDHLAPPANQQAIEFLDKFLDYRAAGQQLRADIDIQGLSLEQQAERLKQTRRDLFGEEVAQRLFGDEEKLLDVSIAKRRVIEDKSLSPEERQQKISELDKELPEAMLTARKEAAQPLTIAAQVDDMRKQGATPEEIQQLRTRELGEEAANRLQQLDAERAELDRKVEAYREYANSIKDVSKAERDSLLQSYLMENLDPAEQRRIPALSALKDQSRQ